MFGSNRFIKLDRALIKFFTIGLVKSNYPFLDLSRAGFEPLTKKHKTNRLTTTPTPQLLIIF